MNDENNIGVGEWDKNGVEQDNKVANNSHKPGPPKPTAHEKNFGLPPSYYISTSRV